ncbi:MAG: choice-of-anchor V domain-containing protein [Bacteroidia bacterium]
MLNKYLLSFVIVTTVFIAFDTCSESHQLHSYSTGAPGPAACTGCHGGAAINSGSGSASVSIVGDPIGYVPGQTYQIQVSVATFGRSKFGFALSADNGSGSSRGTLNNGGNSAVQVQSNYATHTSSGLSGTDSKTWTFNWTAPATAQGTVRFLAYGNASNSSNSDNGDLIYSATKTLAPATTGMADITALGSVEVYPNPVKDKFNLSIQLKKDGIVKAELINRNGTKVQQLFTESFETGANLIPVHLPEGLSKGIYYLLLQQNGQSTVKTIFVQ